MSTLAPSRPPKHPVCQSRTPYSLTVNEQPMNQVRSEKPVLIGWSHIHLKLAPLTWGLCSWVRGTWACCGKQMLAFLVEAGLRGARCARPLQGAVILLSPYTVTEAWYLPRQNPQIPHR